MRRDVLASGLPAGALVQTELLQILKKQLFSDNPPFRPRERLVVDSSPRTHFSPEPGSFSPGKCPLTSHDERPDTTVPTCHD
jgi:hypothetical protein